MPDKTEKELRRELAKIRDEKGTDGVAPDDLSVEWRDADPEARPEGRAWDAENATLTYDAWSAQQEFLDALNDEETDLAAFLAGYGSGKSVMGARWLLAQAINFPGSRFLAMGIDFTKARDTTFRTLFESLPGERTGIVTSSFNGPESSPIVADYNRAEHRLTFINDSVITLGSADKWNRYAGAQYGGIWMDEPSHYGEELHDLLEMMVSRLRGVAGPKVIGMTLTGNGYNAAWRVLEKREDSNGEPLGTEISLVRASTLENPYLDEATKERFERQYADTDRAGQALYGGFEAAQGLVYDEFRRDRHVISHSEALDRRDGSWRVYGYDAGYSDPRVLLEVTRTPQNQLIVLNEFHERESYVEDAIEWLERRPDGTIISEHEPSDRKRFERAGWSTVQADKAMDAGIADVSRRLEEDEHLQVSDSPGTSGGGRRTVPISYGSTRRQRRGGDTTTAGEKQENHEDSDTDADTETRAAVGLLVSEKCENLIQEFLSYKEEDKGASNARDHCLDALRYVVHTNESSAGDDDRRERPDHHGIRSLG